MTAGELRMVREFLGLTLEELAARLDVTERTVRNWEAARYAIPDGVAVEVEGLEEFTGDAVRQLVAALHDARDPAVLVYADDEQLHAARPGLPGWVGARWWRMVVARACQEAPGVDVGYAGELAGDPDAWLQ